MLLSSAWDKPGDCFTNVSRVLQNNLAKIYNVINHIYGENFKLKLCTRDQSIALGTRYSFRLTFSYEMRFLQYTHFERISGGAHEPLVKLAWKKSHDKKIDIYDIPAIAGAAWVQSFNPPNIISGFEKAGIFPYAPHKFEHEFATSQFDARETIESPSHLTPVATLRPLPSVAQSSNVIKEQDPAAQETMQIQNRSSKTKHPAFSEDSYVTETEPTGDDGPKTKSSTTPESLPSLLTENRFQCGETQEKRWTSFLKATALLKFQSLVTAIVWYPVCHFLWAAPALLWMINSK